MHRGDSDVYVDQGLTQGYSNRLEHVLYSIQRLEEDVRASDDLLFRKLVRLEMPGAERVYQTFSRILIHIHERRP